MRIGPRESPGHFLASGMGPAAEIHQEIPQTPDQPPPAAAMLGGQASLPNGNYPLACSACLGWISTTIQKTIQTDHTPQEGITVRF